MDTEQIPVARVAPGTLILDDTGSSGGIVDAVVVTPDGVDFTLTGVHDSATRRRHFATDATVWRGDPAAVHHKDEFLGMTLGQAQAWAGALGWQLRNRSESGWFTDDLRRDRVDVWLDETGTVVRTAMQ